MWSFSEPSQDSIGQFLDSQSHSPWTYPEVGATAGDVPLGYDVDHHRFRLGRGADVYRRACDALRSWQQFPGPWTRIEPRDATITEGSVVAMVARVYGLWWLNACRVVYTFDEESPLRRFGFAYGTLTQHVETGEERFSVEWRADDSVWYDVRAFSRPRYWLVRATKPLARRLQHRFVRESQRIMERIAQGTAEHGS